MKIIKKRSNGADQYLEEFIPWVHLWTTNTTTANTGDIGFNDAVPADATEIFFDTTDHFGFGVEEIGLETIKIGDFIRLTYVLDVANFFLFKVTGDPFLSFSDIKIPVDHIQNGTGPVFVGVEEIGITIYRSGGGGGGGLAISPPLVYDIATADADPGAGKVRFDNTTFSAITQIFADDLDNNGLDISARYENIKAGDIIYGQQSTDATKSVLFDVLGPAVDAGGYFQIPVAFNQAGTGGNIDDAATIGIEFKRGPSDVKKITKTHTDFQTAGLTNSIEIYSALAGEKIFDVVQDVTTLFAGTGITDYSSQVGVSGDENRYTAIIPLDVTVTGQEDNDNADIPDWNGVTSIIATATSVGANLDQSTGGSITYYIRTIRIK